MRDLVAIPLKPLRVVSLNANKRTQNARNLALLESWLDENEPGLLLLQEPWVHGALSSSKLGQLEFVGGDSNVAAFAVSGLPVSLHRQEGRWLTLSLGSIRFHNVYFPAASTDTQRRAEFLDALAKCIVGDRDFSHVVVGDFNMAPTPTDGIYDDKQSTWTGERERGSFARLVSVAGLVDSTWSLDSPDRFTLERLVNGKPSRFRCDLALVDQRLFQRGAARVVVDHSVRRGTTPFTDHSALKVDLEDVAATGR